MLANPRLDLPNRMRSHAFSESVGSLGRANDRTVPNVFRTFFKNGDVLYGVFLRVTTEFDFDGVKTSTQIKTVVDNVVFPVIDMVLAIAFFVKLGTAYFDCAPVRAFR